MLKLDKRIYTVKGIQVIDVRNDLGKSASVIFTFIRNHPGMYRKEIVSYFRNLPSTYNEEIILQMAKKGYLESHVNSFVAVWEGTDKLIAQARTLNGLLRNIPALDEVTLGQGNGRITIYYEKGE